MKDIITDAVLACLANPQAASLEVLRVETGVSTTARLIEAAVTECGAAVVNRYTDDSGRGAFVPPRRETVVFRARPVGTHPRRRDHIILVPALQASVERCDGEVWVRFGLAERMPERLPDRAAA